MRFHLVIKTLEVVDLPHLKNKLGIEKDRYRLAGVLILFNNLLQSLFKSQILTHDSNHYNHDLPI